jgi:hypothetical protein
VNSSLGNERDLTLLELLDRALDKGVILWGDLTLSVAEVDLAYVGLKVLLSSVETAERMRRTAAAPHLPGPMADSRLLMAPSPIAHRPSPIARMEEKILGDPGDLGAFATELERAVGAGFNPALPQRVNADPEGVERGLAQLVLTLIELLRQLLERQALRRLEAGSLSDEEIERLGQTFMKLAEKMEELKQIFGLANEELNLHLGPLGDLL